MVANFKAHRDKVTDPLELFYSLKSKVCLRCFLDAVTFYSTERDVMGCDFPVAGQCCWEAHEHRHNLAIGTFIWPEILPIDGKNGVAIHMTVARSSGGEPVPHGKLETLRLFFQNKEMLTRSPGGTLPQRNGGYVCGHGSAVSSVINGKHSCRNSKKANHMTFSTIALRFLACVSGPIEKCYFLIYLSIPGSLTCLASTMLEFLASLIDHGLPLSRVFILTEGTDTNKNGVYGQSLIVNAVDLLDKLLGKFDPAGKNMEEDENLYIDRMLTGC